MAMARGANSHGLLQQTEASAFHTWVPETIDIRPHPNFFCWRNARTNYLGYQKYRQTQDMKDKFFNAYFS